MRFPEVFDRVIGHEGGYVNDPNDPGGETQWGISKRSYPHLNIRMLTRAEAMGIYDRDFWQPLHGDRLHDRVSTLRLRRQ
jgi:lysozyme family protein